MENIKFSSLYRFIKGNNEFVGLSKIPEVSCLCPECANFSLLLEGIEKSQKKNHEFLVPTNCHDFLDMYCCQPIKYECSENTCDKCPEINSLFETLNDLEIVSFLIWQPSEKYFKKEQMQSTGKDIVQYLKSKFIKLKTHFYTKRLQSAKYSHMTKNIAEGEILIHVDYSENFKNKQQEEVKTAFYGQQQFSLYTACVYYYNKNHTSNEDKIKVKNFVHIPSINDHTCEVSYVLNKYILKQMKDIVSFQKVSFWSDGCTSQFRSQFAFQLLTCFDKDLSLDWHFFLISSWKGSS